MSNKVNQENFYKINNIKYHITFSLSLAICHPILIRFNNNFPYIYYTGPEYCYFCKEYGFIDEIFIKYCDKCQDFIDYDDEYFGESINEFVEKEKDKITIKK